jgi:GAF domain-containing protein
VLWTGFALMLLLTLLAFVSSLGAWDRPIAGVLVDPFGTVDSFGWPSWSGFQQGLAYPDRILSVREQPLGEQAGLALDQAAQRALADGSRPTPDPTLQVMVSRNGTLRTLVLPVHHMGFVPWLVLLAGYQILAWIWLGAAGILYTARPQSRAVASFGRWVLIASILLITLFDFHTTRWLVPITLIAYACLPSALLEIGVCFPERIQLLVARPALTGLFRILDLVFVSIAMFGYLTGHSYRLVCDVGFATAILTLTITLTIRCAQAQGNRRIQILVALGLLFPLYLIVGGMLLWAPEQTAAYLFVLVIPLTVLAALGMAYALLRYDIWDSRTLLRKPGLRRLFAAAFSFFLCLLGVVGFVIVRSAPPAVQILCVLGLLAATSWLLRGAEAWLDRTLFPTEVRYEDTVEKLSLRFSDLSSVSAVCEVVERSVQRATDCSRARLLAFPAAAQEIGADSRSLSMFLPKVAQAMAAADADMQSASQTPALAAAAVPEESAPAASSSVRQLLRRAVRTAALFSLSPEQEDAVMAGQLVYLVPTRNLNASLQSLWSWLVLAVFFRDKLIGVLAISPKSIAQVLTPATESLLRTLTQQAGLALHCAGQTEQLEARRDTQERVLHQQAELTCAALAHEVLLQLRAAPPQSPPSTSPLHSLADSLAHLSQPPMSKGHPLLLRDLIEQARLLLADRLRARLLEVDLPSGIEIIQFAPTLTLLLRNLLSFALDACPLPGRIGISAQIDAEGGLQLMVWDSRPVPASIPSLLERPSDAQRPNALAQASSLAIARSLSISLVSETSADRTTQQFTLVAAHWRRSPPPRTMLSSSQGGGSSAPAL